MQKQKKSLFFIGSPYFDGIGLLNTEAKKLSSLKSVVLLDGITPGKYPEINNFNFQSWLHWKLLRSSQFRKAIPNHKYYHIKNILHYSKNESSTNKNIAEVLDISMADHFMCIGLNMQSEILYRKNNYLKQLHFLTMAYESFLTFLKREGIAEIVVFNGRNALARILILAAKDLEIPIRWLEYFGKRNESMTYISSPVDIFDLDKFSEYVLQEYDACTDINKNKIAIECLDNRIKSGDPLLHSWGMRFDNNKFACDKNEKKLAAFFFSSEDEYPAFASSRYGIKPPNHQYETFKRICDKVIENGLKNQWKFLLKLHPRYIAFNKKLKPARVLWEKSISYAKELGINLEVIQPLTTPYEIIKMSDIVFAYGTIAWEATYLSKPSVLLGPNVFSTHGCCHIANSIDDVIVYLQDIPLPLSVDKCYPYAWAWREMGLDSFGYETDATKFPLRRLANVLSNRFSLVDHV